MKTLHFNEILVACSSIDAVSASISMAFSDKEVLAARKLVSFGFMAQLFSFGVLGASIARLRQYTSSPCVRGIRHPVFNNQNQIHMWIYFAIRVALVLIPVPLAHGFSERLNIIEHDRQKGPHIREARIWESLPASLFSNYVLFSSLSLVHAVAVFATPQSMSRKESMQALWSEWGQSAPFIVGVVVILHVLYTVWKILHDRQQARGRSNALPPLPALYSADSLLLDYSPLRTQAEMLKDLTPEEEDQLWLDLQEAFKTNDRTWIYHCLDSGAPLSRKTSQNEYPIHMAARFGDVAVLEKVCLPVRSHHLRERNSSAQTPLEIALFANNAAAIKWIVAMLAQQRQYLLPHDQKDVDDTVIGCIFTAVDSKNPEAIVALTSWPNWQELTLDKNLPKQLNICSGESIVCQCLLLADDVDLFPLFVDQGALQHLNEDSLLVVVESILAKTNSRDTAIILLDRVPKDRIQGLIILHTLRLGLGQHLLDMGADPSMIFLYAAPGGYNTLVRSLLNTKISDQMLDYAYLTGDLDEETEAALVARGAHHWGSFLDAASHGNLPQLVSAIEGARSNGTLARMMQAIGRDGMSAITLFIEHCFIDDRKSLDTSMEVLDILVEAGASPNTVDLYQKTALHYLSDNYYLQPEMIEQLVKAMDPALINLIDHSGNTALLNLCSKFRLGSEEQLAELIRTLKVLLKYGANSKILDFSGLTSLDYMKQILSASRGESRNWRPFNREAIELLENLVAALEIA